MSLNLLPRYNPPRPWPRAARRSRARGGTFLGLIVGVIAGLAVALCVVIYVAKVPIPFVNKAPVHSSDQDAAEDQKNRNWNPNSPLQTRGPTLPASTASQPPVTVPPPVEVAPPSQTSPQSRPVGAIPPASNAANAQPGSRNARPTPSGDVLGDFAAARARAAGNVNGNAHAPAATAATAEPFTYFVQTGAFSSPQDADAERARLSLQGMEAAITQRDQAGRVIYRVRVGPFQNKAAADQIRERLAGSGFDAALVRVQR